MIARRGLFAAGATMFSIVGALGLLFFGALAAITDNQGSQPHGGYGTLAGTDVPVELQPYFVQAGLMHGLPPTLVAAVGWKESGWSPDVIFCSRTSTAGARGVMQFMPATAAGVPRAAALGYGDGSGIDPCDPAEAIPAGAWYLRRQADAFGGDVEYALAAYNAGPGRARTKPWPAETRAYVPAVLAKQAEYDLIASQGGGGAPTGVLIRPASGPITSDYGMRRHPITGVLRLHAGVDFGAPHGSPIFAAAPGIVTRAGEWGGYGLAVELAHGGGFTTRYAHMSAIGVARGQRVAAGQVIGLVGSTGQSTGPHLHFEVRINDVPQDPMLWLGRGG